MAAYVDTSAATVGFAPEIDSRRRGTATARERSEPVRSHKQLRKETRRTGEPVDADEKGEDLRNVFQPSDEEAPYPIKAKKPTIVESRRSGTDERVALSRTILTTIDSVEASIGKVGLGSEVESLKRLLASSYGLLDDTADAASFLSMVSMVERTLEGVELGEYPKVVPVIRFVFRLCFERPTITDSDVASARAELDGLGAKAVPMFGAADQFEDDTDEYDAEEED